ncbi:hypothetical protein V8E52_010091 [Russula decolorans]
MSSAATFTCRYCSRAFTSELGRRSHVQQNAACQQTMLEAETSSSSKNPKHHHGEESISETEDAEMSDLQDDRSPSPHHDAHEVPIFPPENLNSPIPLNASVSEVTIEEVEDIDAPGQSSGEGEMSEEGVGFEFIEDYPAEAGMPGPGRRKKTPFEKLKRAQREENQEPWSPFANEEEWELARWLMTVGVSQARVDEFLKLSITQKRTKPSYHNKRALLEKIDALPDVPGWTCEVFEITGDQVDARDARGERKLTEEVELWRRDPVEYAKRTNEKFDNMWTCEWWWDLQKVLEPGAIIAPVILASDKTQLSDIEAGKSGVQMICADCPYVADHPEQCLVTCCMENRCPSLEVPTHSAFRDHSDTLRILTEQSQGLSPDEFKEQGLRPIWPFWADLPHCDIFACITPDLLHQLHKGLFKDHIVSWSTDAAEGGASMPPHPTLRHFKKGISLVTQWTGTEYKNMEKVFLGIIVGIAEPEVVRAVRGVLDFIYYAHFETHDLRSLAKLDEAWVHSSKHYLEAIRSQGSAAGFNSEGMERLHIDYAKIGYRATNKKHYIKQMTRWLTRQEKIHHFAAYLQWAVPGYSVATPTESEPLEQASKCGYSIAKMPSYLNIPLKTVQDDFGADNIIPCIETYLRRLGRPVPHVANPMFSLFKRMYVWIPAAPQVSNKPTKDTIIATRPEGARGIRKKTIPGQFSTILVQESECTSNNPLDGLTVARVRAIFKLPVAFGDHPEPLAYVEWFTPLSTEDTDIGMYVIGASTRNRRRRTSVVPVSKLQHSCHLIPRLGKGHIDPTWHSANILDQDIKFYVNCYLWHVDFILLRRVQ